MSNKYYGKNEVNECSIETKINQYGTEHGSCLKSVVCDMSNEKYLSIDSLQRKKYLWNLNIKKYILKIKKSVNKFYFMYFIMTFVHFLIYLNRGIIPGSYDYLSAYLHKFCDISDIDMYIGFLSSIFILGLSISSVISGSLASVYNMIKITIIFLFQNSIALLFTGISFILNSYCCLMFSRFFTGFSEASFIIIIPPLIYSYSKDKAGKWISIFIAMLPLGGCAGYLLAVILSSLGISISDYFIISSFVFIIFSTFFCFFDENMLKEYEENKSLNEINKKRNDEIDIEEGILMKNRQKNLKNGGEKCLKEKKILEDKQNALDGNYNTTLYEIDNFEKPLSYVNEKIIDQSSDVIDTFSNNIDTIIVDSNNYNSKFYNDTYNNDNGKINSNKEQWSSKYNKKNNHKMKNKHKKKQKRKGKSIKYI